MVIGQGSRGKPSAEKLARSVWGEDQRNPPVERLAGRSGPTLHTPKDLQDLPRAKDSTFMGWGLVGTEVASPRRQLESII
jgi:hypothetical protein